MTWFTPTPYITASICLDLLWVHAAQNRPTKASGAAPIHPNSRSDPSFLIWSFNQSLFLVPTSFLIYIYQSSILKFYAVWFHLLLKMHPQYQAHNFLSLHHAKRVSKTSVFHFSSQPICFRVALGKHFLKDRLQRCLLISSAMIIKSCFCRSLWDYQSLKRKFSSFSCSNIYSPPLHLRLSFSSRWWHPGQLHFRMHFLFKCQEGPLIQGKKPSWISMGNAAQMLITVYHSS